jgi:hypothetical protein
MGLFTRRERWALSWRGRLLVLAIFVGLLWFLQHRIHSFLAVTNLNTAEVLVVEGWTPTYTLRAAAAEYLKGKYQRVLVVRGVYESLDKYESGRYSAEYVGNLLVEYGVPRESLQTVFFPVSKKDRTYHAAMAAKQWLATHEVSPKAINVATLGPHARRSRLLYEKAFGSKVAIGVLALEDSAYDPEHWWQSSEGIKQVLSETAAYLYARLFFLPPRSGAFETRAPPGDAVPRSLVSLSLILLSRQPSFVGNPFCHSHHV